MIFIGIGLMVAVVVFLGWRAASRENHISGANDDRNK